MIKELERKYYRIYIKDLETGDEGYIRKSYLRTYDSEFLSKTKGTIFNSIKDVDETINEHLDDGFEIDIEEIKEEVKITVNKKKYYDKITRELAEKYYNKLLKKLDERD